MAHPHETPLEYRTALTQIERALVDRLSLAFQVRRPPVADLPTLRQAQDGRYVMHRDLIFVEDQGLCYRWLDTSAAPDDNSSVIMPAWVTDGGPGRWVRCTDQSLYARRDEEYAQPLCMIRDGYAKAVQLYEGDVSSDVVMQRVLEQRPAILVRWLRTEQEQKSLQPALYRSVYFFQILGISYNPRFGTDAQYGSDLPLEAAEDPGLNAILGDALDCVIGASDHNTGYAHLVPGVDVVQPQGMEIAEESLAERLFIGAARFRVIAYLHRPDYDAAPLTTVGMTTQHINEHGLAVAPDNVLLQGYHLVWPAEGLVHAVQYGRAKVGGHLVAGSPAPVKLPADSAIYRDLKPDGTFIYRATAIGADPPAPVAGALRVGVTTTSSAGIVTDTILAPQITDFAGPDEVS